MVLFLDFGFCLACMFSRSARVGFLLLALIRDSSDASVFFLSYGEDSSPLLDRTRTWLIGFGCYLGAETRGFEPPLSSCVRFLPCGFSEPTGSGTGTETTKVRFYGVGRVDTGFSYTFASSVDCSYLIALSILPIQSGIASLRSSGSRLLICFLRDSLFEEHTSP